MFDTYSIFILHDQKIISKNFFFHKFKLDKNFGFSSYNRRKLDELPYHHYQLYQNIENSLFLSDINWIYDKVCGSNCYQILEDINLEESIKNQFTVMLKSFIETHASVLNYDGRQFFSHFYKFLEDKMRSKKICLENDTKLAEIYKISKNPMVLSFISLNNIKEDFINDIGPVFREINFDLVVRLPGTDHFVVSVSTNKEEVSVWNVQKLVFFLLK